jgi:hypothetical protein
MELQIGWWEGFGERWQRGSMWLANQACFSFVLVPEARVEGCSATCGIKVSISRILFNVLSRGKGYFMDDMVGLNFETRKRISVVDAKPGYHYLHMWIGIGG